MNDALHRTIAVYDLIAEDYSRRWMRSDYAEAVVDALLGALPRNVVVLDAGCGAGRDSRRIAEVGCEVVGVDLSSEMIRIARTHNEDIVARVMDVRQLAFPDSVFDAVLSIGMLHHMFGSDLDKAFAEMLRVLVPGGLMHATLKIGQGLMTDRYGREAHLRADSEVLATVGQVGFDILEAEHSVGDNGQRWLLVKARADKAAPASHPGCPFCPAMMNIEMRVERLSAVGSILWRGSHFFVTIDRSPLVEGHLLICANTHLHSMVEARAAIDELELAKAWVKHMLSSLYDGEIVFLEHGSTAGNASNNPCIAHAHVHAMPLPSAFARQVRASVGALQPFRSLDELAAATSGREYFSLQTEAGGLEARIDGLADLPSQYFRRLVSDCTKADEHRWVSNKNTEAALTQFNATLNACVDFLNGAPKRSAADG